MIERDANAKHAFLTLPARQQSAHVGALNREATHDGETVGVACSRFQRVVVVVAGPGRRNDDGAIDAGFLHHRQELLVGERLGQMRALLTTRNPRTIRRLRRPEMDL